MRKSTLIKIAASIIGVIAVVFGYWLADAIPEKRGFEMVWIYIFSVNGAFFGWCIGALFTIDLEFKERKDKE